MPRDCSNMAAADDFLYVAMGRHCLGFNGQTGRQELTFSVPREAVPSASQAAKHDSPEWGYVACAGDLLLGTATPPGAAFIGDHGEWYDKLNPTETARVAGHKLFALDRRTGRPIWTYNGGAIAHSTLTLGDDRVFFVESQRPQGAKAPRLVGEANQQLTLVALELATGRKMWELPHDFSQAQRMLYLQYANGTVVATGSSRREYHLWAFKSDSGSRLWSKSFAMAKEDHGGAIQHPVLLGDMVYCEQKGLDLRSGEILRSDLPRRRGCGVMAASRHSFFYRDHFHGYWDPQTNTKTEWQGIRGGCWLGQIPAGGLLLAPETSAGCSCTHAIQISVGFVPRKAKPGR